MPGSTNGGDATEIARLRSADEPWVVYNTLRDLMGADPGSAEVQAAYRALQDHPAVEALLAALDVWPTPPLGKAYDPKDSIWKLGILADFGLSDEQGNEIIMAARAHWFEDEESAGAAQEVAVAESEQ